VGNAAESARRQIPERHFILASRSGKTEKESVGGQMRRAVSKDEPRRYLRVSSFSISGRLNFSITKSREQSENVYENKAQ